MKTFAAGTDDEPLSGVSYRVTDGNGGNIGSSETYTSNDTGEIIIPYLAAGTVVNVRQISTADGYVLNGTPKQLTIQSPDVHEIVFRAEKQGAIVIHAFDSKTKAPLSGVAFDVKYTDGRSVDHADGHAASNGRYLTDENGEIRIIGVTGSVIATAQSAPDGYTLDANSRSKTAVVEPDATLTLDFYADPLNTLTVHTFIAGTTTPLSGVAYKVISSNGAVVGETNGEFVSDASGQFVVRNLTPGTTLTIQQIRTVSGYVLTDAPQDVQIKPGDAQSVTFFCEPKGALVVRLKDSENGDPIADASFKITTIGGAFVPDNEGRTASNGVFKTDANGEIRLLNVLPDTYIIEQTSTDGNHVLDSSAQSVKVEAGQTQTAEFTNGALQSVIIQKYAEGSTDPISGVTFFVTDGSGSPIKGNGMFITDAEGRITITGLKPGTTLIAREVKTVKGFQLNSNPQSIVVGAATTQAGGAANQLTFYDSLLSACIVRTYIEGTDREPLSGVAYKVTDGNGGAIGLNDGTWYADENGEITIPELETGTVLNVHPVKVPDGYVLNGTPKQLTIKSSDVHELVFWVAKRGSLIIHTLDSATNAPLEGVTVKVTTTTGELVEDENGKAGSNGLYKSDSAGEIVLHGVVGSFAVTQVETVSGYTTHEATRSQSTTIQPDSTQELTFFSDPTQTLTIHLYEAGTTNPITGASFRVTGSDGAVIGNNNGSYTTDQAGSITISDLVPGLTVTAKQLSTVSGFVLDSREQSIEIKSGDAMSLTFYNAKKGGIVIEKRDAQTDAPLAGAEFKVSTIDGKPVDDNEGRTSTQGVYITDENGQITLQNLAPDTYVITETKAPSGYVLDSAEKSVKVNENDTQTVKFTNTALQSVMLQKLVEGTNTPLAGVTFLITDASGAPVGGGNGEFQTDSNGRIVLTGLVPGTTLIAREVKTVKGFVLNGEPKTIVVGTGGTASTGSAAAATGGASAGAQSGNTLTFFDEPLSTLIVTKLAAGSNTPLKGARFLITDSTGKAIGNGTGEFTTDENGRIVLKDLHPGITVTAKEIEAPKGYVLDSTPKSIEIQSGNVQELTFLNASKQALTINKYVTGTTDPIQGAAFLITDQTGAAVGSGTGEFLTDENGRIVLNDLTPGAVITAKEIRAAAGFVLDSTPKSITIQSGEAQHLDFYNSTTGTLTIIKRDRATNKALKGATFQLTYANGEFVANNGGAMGSNGTFTTDNKGQIIIKGLNPSTIIIRETKAPDGYLLDETPVTVEVGADGSQTVEIYNDSTQALVIQKFVTDTTKPIQGVTFLVTDSSGMTLGPDNGEFVTDKNGRIVLTGLTPGTTITAKEVKTAKGFVLDTTPQSILIKQGEAQRMTFFNSPEGGLELIKVNAADKTQRIANVTFEIRKMDGGLVKTVTTGKDGCVYVNLDAGDYYAVEIETAKMQYNFTVANTSNVELDSFFFHDKLPYDVTTATAITTGTYSQRMTYRILYKTNMSEYRVLASNLLTTNNYAYQLSGLPLMEGEAVTDIYFDFGKVPAGFQCVAKPTLTVQASGTAVNGYQIINRADAGGQYGGTWQTANASWITVLVNLTPKAPLPKTGY